MVTKRKRFSEEVRCEHCGHDTPLEVLGPFSSPSGSPHLRFHYDLRFCPACHRASLCQLSPEDDGTLSHEYYEFVYPTRQRGPAGLPTAIARAYDAAAKVKAIDVNAYGVLVGRLLEMVCTDRSARGETLDEQLRDLAARQEIPDKLVNVARRLRQMRNIGAHASLGDLTSQELPILKAMTDAILEYVYSAPHLVKEAETRLNQLKRASSRQSKRKGKPKKSLEGADPQGDPRTS